MSSYAEKLRDPRWQRKRLEVLEAANFRCSWCYNKEETLHAHHTIYIKGREPWEYEDWQIICLCATCHQTWHDIKDELDSYFATLNAENVEWAMRAVYQIMKAQQEEESAVYSEGRYANPLS